MIESLDMYKTAGLGCFLLGLILVAAGYLATPEYLSIPRLVPRYNPEPERRRWWRSGFVQYGALLIVIGVAQFFTSNDWLFYFWVSQ